MQTIHDYLTTAYSVVRRLSPQTEVTLRASVSTLGQWLGRAATFADLTDNSVSLWVRWMEELGLSPSTIKGKRADILTIWRHAWENGLSPNQPNPRKIRRAPRRERNPVAWSIAEFRALLDAARRTPGYLKNGVPKAIYFAALLSAAYDTGLRRCDLLALQLSGMSADGCVTLTQHKTGQVHTARLSDDSLMAIKALQNRLILNNEPHDAPLSWRQDESNLYQNLRAICQRAGVPLGALQQCRRTGATAVEAAESGAAAKYLGHRSPGLAAASYLDRRYLPTTTPLPPRP